MSGELNGDINGGFQVKPTDGQQERELGSTIVTVEAVSIQESSLLSVQLQFIWL